MFDVWYDVSLFWRMVAAFYVVRGSNLLFTPPSLLVDYYLIVIIYFFGNLPF